MSEKTIRFASYGTSSIMDVMQEAMKQTPGVECAVVTSRDAGRAAAYAQKIGISESCGSFEEVLKRDDIDAVYIATPNSCHVEQVIQALSSGKHVVVEKPASLDTAGIRAMMEAAEKNHVYFFEAITTIFMPNFIACKDMLSKLGHLTDVSIRYGQYSSKLDGYLKGNVPNNMNPAVAGGALNDMGIYAIHAAVALFGEPDEIRYEPIYGPNNADVEGSLTLTYHTYPSHLSHASFYGVESGSEMPSGEGLVCHLHTSKIRNTGSGLYIAGTQGYFEENGPLNNFAVCRAGVGLKESTISLQPDCNRMLYEMNAFRDAINSHDDAFYQKMCRQSLAASRVLEESHKTMRW